MAELRRAVTAVAQEHNLPESWLSDAVKGFADILPRDFYHRLVPLDLPLEHLHLYVLGQPEQVAMKIVALREQDLEDLELLLPQMSDTDKATVVAIIGHVATVRPDWAQKMRYFLLEQGWKID
jgi:alkanesulfonate monooxygenase SsuD/methylene tetrahydromethanopterin reductase-like flavin-dependent oxidoreductase (luciferase family)